MLLVLNVSVTCPLIRIVVTIASRSAIGDDPRPHRLERVAILGAPERAVVRLPGALAHVVADGPAEHVIERFLLRHVAAALAEHRDQLALVLELLAGIARLHDILLMRDQRIVGAIADVGARRIGGLGAALCRHAIDVIAIVHADAEEGARDHRQFELHARERRNLPGRFVIAPRSAIDFDDGVVLDCPERRLAANRIPAPFHGFLRVLAQPFRGIERRRDDRHIAGAAADVAAQKFAQLRLARVGCLRANTSRATSGCRRCRSRIAARDGGGTPPATPRGGRAPAQGPRRCGCSRRRPARRASGRRAPARRRSGSCRRRTRRARSRHACR